LFSASRNGARGRRLAKDVAHDALLFDQLLSNQFPRDLHSNHRASRERLRTPQTRIFRSSGSSRNQHRPIAIKHGEGGPLIGEPPQRSERHGAICAYHRQSLQVVPNARKSRVPTLDADPILENEVSVIDANVNAVAKQGDDAARWSERTRDGR